MSAMKKLLIQDEITGVNATDFIVSEAIPANANTKTALGEIIINPPVLSVSNGRARIAAEIRIDGNVKTLWFETDEIYKDFIAVDTLDAFVASILIPAILRGKNIRVNGSMSGKLFYSLSYSLIPIFCEYLEKPQLTQIIPDAFTGKLPGGAGVVAGFSGGIDSFCTYYDHSYGRVPDEFQLTHFFFNNVGSHGQNGPDTDRTLFFQRLNRLQDCLKKIGKPAVAVDSNLDEFISGKFQLTHTLRNCVVALLLQKQFAKFLYSSGYPLTSTKVGPGYNMAPLDPVILPLLSTERLECMGSGGQHSRVEKTRRVIKIEESRRYLDVCVAPEKAPTGIVNCGVCCKCIRTATTLKVFGKLKEYARTFDLKSFAMVENFFLIEVMGGNSPFSREIRQLIADKKFPIPFSVRLIGALLPSAVAQQFSIRIIPALLRFKPLARFMNGCLAW